MQERAEQVARSLRSARRVLVVTGAGMSADSGLPTYRGTAGLYTNAETEEGVPIEVALSGPMFRRDPAVCWRHIGRIEQACRGARPHEGHHVLARLQERMEVVVLTQNVDGLHQAAGSRDVIEIHGNIHELRCPRCSWRLHVETYEDLAAVPTCPECGAVVRPDVVLFEEMLPTRALGRLSAVTEQPFDLVFAIGTSALFPYIVSPVIQQARTGGATVEIDPGETALTHIVRHKLRCGAAEGLTAIEAALRQG
ncbi:MAG: NAD-dependent protein deacylase [Alphaproteobacteria bacterium]|nr:NAD-dependent protein deacylase [Alphaproteobacteria bacterium]